MEIKAKRKDLIAALKIAASCVPNKANLPMLANALFESKENQIAITCTNLEQRISTTCDAEINGSGCTTIPARKLLSVLDALSDEDVLLKCDLETYHTQLKCGSSKIKFLGLSAEDFPQIQQNEDVQKIQFSVDTNDLRTLIDRTVYAVGVNESRKILNGMLWDMEQNTITAVGTDSKRLAISSIGYVVPLEKQIQRVIPVEAVNFLRTLKSEKVELIFDEFGKKIEANAGNITFTSKIIEGAYPNYKQVIPTQFLHTIEIDSEIFLAKLNIISMIAGDDKYISMTFNNDSLIMFAENATNGKAEDTMSINAATMQEPLTVTINSMMLATAVKSCAGKKFSIQINNNFSPLKFDFNNGAYGVIMPIRK